MSTYPKIGNISLPPWCPISAHKDRALSPIFLGLPKGSFSRSLWLKPRLRDVVVLSLRSYVDMYNKINDSNFIWELKEFFKYEDVLYRLEL